MTPAPSPVLPPRIKSPASPGFFVGTVLAMTVLACAAVVFFFNPVAYGFYPVCQFHRLTGLNCPGCGATRALYALLHGHPGMALRDNALFVVLFISTAVRSAWFFAMKSSGRPVGQFFPMRWLWPLLAITAVFAVLRNLPAFSFLSP